MMTKSCTSIPKTCIKCKIRARHEIMLMKIHPRKFRLKVM
jgi:hypothetical protein